MAVIFRWGDVDHMPLFEGNIFVENDDHWWGSRCGTTDTRERRKAELSIGAPTCLLCIDVVRRYEARYGRGPDDGERRLASRLELNHGQKESADVAATAEAEDPEHVVCSSACGHRAH